MSTWSLRNFFLADLWEYDYYYNLTDKEFKEVTEKLKSSQDPDEIEKYNNMPTPERIDAICKYLMECSEKKERVALHCGSGDGRSGMVKVALAIKTLLAKDPAYRTENKVSQNIRCSDRDKEHEVEIFPVVSAAIDQIRATHPKVIEIRVDISVLQNYAEYLLGHYKIDVSERSS